MRCGFTRGCTLRLTDCRVLVAFIICAVPQRRAGFKFEQLNAGFTWRRVGEETELSGVVGSFARRGFGMRNELIEKFVHL